MLQELWQLKLGKAIRNQFRKNVLLASKIVDDGLEYFKFLKDRDIFCKN